MNAESENAITEHILVLVEHSLVLVQHGIVLVQHGFLCFFTRNRNWTEKHRWKNTSLLTYLYLIKLASKSSQIPYFQEGLDDDKFFSDEREEDEDEEDEYSLDSQSSYVLPPYELVVESDKEEEDSFGEEKNPRIHQGQPTFSFSWGLQKFRK